MLSIETEARITKLLLALAEGEKSIEIIRQIICGKIDFDPLSAFKLLDKKNNNYLTENDIKFFLKYLFN